MNENREQILEDIKKIGGNCHSIEAILPAIFGAVARDKQFMMEEVRLNYGVVEANRSDVVQHHGAVPELYGLTRISWYGHLACCHKDPAFPDVLKGVRFSTRRLPCQTGKSFPSP